MTVVRLVFYRVNICVKIKAKVLIEYEAVMNFFLRHHFQPNVSYRQIFMINLGKGKFLQLKNHCQSVSPLMFFRSHFEKFQKIILKH